jgi:hypothetical protein
MTRRIENEERRTRLARRHCLAAESRAVSPLDATNALVALHSTDPATVFLSTRARVRDFQVRQLEAALYEAGICAGPAWRRRRPALPVSMKSTSARSSDRRLAL